MKKNTKVEHKSQVERQKSFIKGFISRTNAAINSARDIEIAKANRTEKRAIAHIAAWMIKRYDVDFIACLLKGIIVDRVMHRRYFSEIFGYSEDYVGELLKELEALGLIRVIQTFGHALEFYFGPLVQDATIRTLLKPLLPTLQFVVLLSCLTSQNIQSESSALKNKSKTEETGSGSGKKINKQLREEALLERYDYCPAEMALGTKVPNDAYLKRLEYSPTVSDNFKEPEVASTISIRPICSNLSSLELTLHGMIKLDAFPTAAILVADTATVEALRSGVITDPFKYLMKVAIRYCKENNIKPDYDRTSELMRSHAINPNSGKVSLIRVKPEPEPVVSAADDSLPLCCRFKQATVADKQKMLRSRCIPYQHSDRGPEPALEHHRKKLSCKESCAS